MQKRMKRILTVVLFMLICGGCQKKEEQGIGLQEAELAQTETEEKEKEDTQEETIYVYVCGAVVQEGVYELKQGSRVYEAVEMAGGFAEGAAVSTVNQAALLKDEERLYIPTVEEAEASTEEQMGNQEEDGKVNLNTATREELMTLAGIGESKADSIIRYREEHGRFQSIEEIKQIEGIKDGVFQKIKEMITV